MPLFVTVKVGTQDFRLVDCDSTEDITFQLGTLNETQKAYLGLYRHYAGAAIRTEYDEVYLKGRGFIFMAADIGPERYEGEALNRFWSVDDSLLFYRVLLHELGHVFGIPHLDIFSSPIGLGAAFMEAGGPEAIVAGKGSRWPLDTDTRLGIFKPTSPTAGLCKGAGNLEWPLRRFLEVPIEYRSIAIQKRSDHYAVLIRTDADAPPLEHAIIRIDPQVEIEKDYLPFVAVKVTPNQKVYKVPSPGSINLLKHLPGPGLVQIRMSGQLDIGKKVQKPLGLTKTYKGTLELSGILDGRLVMHLQ